MRDCVYMCVRGFVCVGVCACVSVCTSMCAYVRVGVRACVCYVRAFDRVCACMGECRVGRALVSLASWPPPRVCKA